MVRRYVVSAGLMVLALVVAACGGDAGSSGETAATTTTTAALAAGLAWSRVPHDEAALGGANGQEMWSVVVGGPGLVAVGDDWSGGDGDGIVWTSPNGVEWTRTDAAVLGGPGDQRLTSVVARGTGLIAVGHDGSGGDRDAAVWTSPDGLVWTRVPHDEGTFGGPDVQGMTSVVVGGPGLVASGYDASGGNWDAAVWTSVDGLVWSRVPHDEAAFGGTGEQTMSSLVVGGSGLVAVGWDGSGDDFDAAVWTSVDGLVWSRVPHDEAAFGGTGDQMMPRLAVGGPGLVAVGWDASGGDWDAAVWTSPDGLVWSRVPHDEAAFGDTGDQAMMSLVVGGPGLVAVGWDAFGQDADAAVWTSPDGSAWSRVPHDEATFGGSNNQMIYSAVVGGPGLVAIGWDASGDDADAALWVSPPPGGATSPETITITEPPTTTTTAALVAGLAWSRVPHDEASFGGANGQEMLSVVEGGPGLVAVGWDYAGDDRDAAAVWTSVDGLVWSRVPHDEAIFGGPDRQKMRSVAVGGPGLVAVGWDESGGDWDAAVWVSPDGLVWTRVPHDEATFGGLGLQEMVSVVVGGPGLIAVGDDSGKTAVWTSVDGLVWSRVPPDLSAFGGMNSVVVGGPGLVAVGADDFTGGSSADSWDAAVWTSPDGLVWSRVPHDAAIFGGPGAQFLWSVVVGGPGLVAVGWDASGGDFDAAVWTSPDGLVWSRVPHDAVAFGGSGDQEMVSVAVGGPGLVAVGHDEWTAAVWTSPDGLVWSQVPHVEAAFGGPEEMLSVVVGGPGVVAVGSDASGADADAAVWVSPAPD